MPLTISNKTARHVAIHCAGLSVAPTGPCDKNRVLALIKKLGYVQLDPLMVVARAHDHILWSRNTQYRPKFLNSLLSEQLIFEHFCHDACVLPMETLPIWADQFERQANKLTSRQWRSTLTKKEQSAVLRRFKQEGALRSNDFSSPATASPKAVWSKPTHKKILDYLWLRGELAVVKRQNFSKYYNLSERFYHSNPRISTIKKTERIDWLCAHAMQCLGFTNSGEIMRFWDAFDLDTAKAWCELNKSNLIATSVETSNQEYKPFITHRSNESLLRNPPPPTKRLRILNPFDPLIRDRKRLHRLFGFEYRIEIYTPPAKRQYGYYVYPILEFDRFVGRIEVKHNRQENDLVVDNLWAESGVKFGQGRMAKLHSELERMRRFCGAKRVNWSE